MNQQLKTLLFATFFLIVCGALASIHTGYGHTFARQLLEKASANNPSLYEVVEFADGDTISVKIGDTVERIRFIGVDTPEKNHPDKPVQCFALAASAFTKGIIGSSKVRLEADPINSNRDRYDRLLRYVYLPDGTFVNEAIIMQGYGFAYTAFPFSKMSTFIKSEEKAKRASRGLWSKCAVVNDGGYMQTNAVQ